MCVSKGGGGRDRGEEVRKKRLEREREGKVERQKTIVEGKDAWCGFIEMCEWMVEYLSLVPYAYTQA